MICPGANQRNCTVIFYNPITFYDQITLDVNFQNVLIPIKRWNVIYLLQCVLMKHIHKDISLRFLELSLAL